MLLKCDSLLYINNWNFFEKSIIEEYIKHVTLAKMKQNNKNENKKIN